MGGTQLRIYMKKDTELQSGHKAEAIYMHPEELSESERGDINDGVCCHKKDEDVQKTDRQNMLH